MKTSALATSLLALASLASAVDAQCPTLGPVLPEKLEVSGLGASAFDQIGIAVDIDGDTAVVGSWLFDLFAPGDNVGAAYVFERVNGCWQLEAQLISPVGDEFGRAVSISGDRILVGNWKEFNSQLGVTGPGAAYVYERNAGGCWGVTAKLEPMPGQSDPWSFFGSSVDLDGDRAVIGAREDNDNGGDEGAVYVFENTGGVWNQTQKILPPSLGPSLPNWFGNSVSLDGDRLLIGAHVTTCDQGAAVCSTCFTFDCPDTCACDEGRAFIYEHSAGSFNLAATLIASDAAPGDGFGAVALSGDTAVVGAYEADDACMPPDANCNSGAAYVFERDPNGNWLETAKLVPSDTEATDNFGWSVALEGNVILVGARNWDGVLGDVGTGYVFAKQGTAWNEIHTLSPMGRKGGSRSGWTLALSEDGRTAMLGSPGDNGAITGSGAAYAIGTSFSADRDVVVLSTGDVVNFSLWAGAEAGHENQLYFILGSVSGTCPGFPLDGQRLPLNVADEYFNYTLGNAGAPPLANAFGNLDANAQANASFSVPAGLSPNLAGVVFHHAYVTLDLEQIPGAAVVDFVSNAVGFQVVP